MTVEVNKVAYLKTTDEPVFVLNMRKDANTSQTIVTVRRPIQGEGGVVHSIEEFLFDELHSPKARVVAEMENNKFMLEQRDALAKARQEASRVELPDEAKPETYVN